MRRALVVLGCLAASCGQTVQPPLCTPGKSEACVGPGGCMGGQVCNAAGSGYGACDCGMLVADSGIQDAGQVDSGTPDAGPPDAGAPDAGPDARPPDAGPGVLLPDGGACTPSTLDGGPSLCASNQKCSWLYVDDSPPTGQMACTPNGTAPIGSPCTDGPPGATTGFDTCARGGVCISGTCRAVCLISDPDSCGAEQCVAHAGLFSNDLDEPAYGACIESCNPLTQLTSGNVSCGANKGCYLLTSMTNSLGVCAGAGTVAHNVTITGPAFANTCVPGAQPRAVSGSNTQECGGLCAPAPVTSTMNTADEGGVGTNSCQTRWSAPAPSDAMGGESCRYYWAREPFTTLSRYSNSVGFCFKHAAWQYDSNGDLTPDAPFPRCTTVTTGDVLPPIMQPAGNDALYFWCIPQPIMKVGQPRLQHDAPWRPMITGWR